MPQKAIKWLARMNDFAVRISDQHQPLPKVYHLIPRVNHIRFGPLESRLHRNPNESGHSSPAIATGKRLVHNTKNCGSQPQRTPKRSGSIHGRRTDAWMGAQVVEVAP
jgi:hypothetical protein